MKNIHELTLAIIEWEAEAQESFTDYYMHDCINWADWSKWLFHNGHKDRSMKIYHQIQKGNTCIDQELLFRVHGCETPKDLEDYAIEVVEWREDEDKWLELYRKDVYLWAQYMFADEETLAHITNWLDKYPETWL